MVCVWTTGVLCRWQLCATRRPLHPARDQALSSSPHPTAQLACSSVKPSATRWSSRNTATRSRIPKGWASSAPGVPARSEGGETVASEPHAGSRNKVQESCSCCHQATALGGSAPSPQREGRQPPPRGQSRQPALATGQSRSLMPRLAVLQPLEASWGHRVARRTANTQHPPGGAISPCCAQAAIARVLAAGAAVPHTPAPDRGLLAVAPGPP